MKQFKAWSIQRKDSQGKFKYFYKNSETASVGGAMPPCEGWVASREGQGSVPPTLEWVEEAVVEMVEL